MVAEIETQKISWALLEYDQLKLYIAATEKGLCYVGSPGRPFSELEALLHKRYPEASLTENSDALTPYLEELRQYFKGARKEFGMSLDMKGTPFQEEIWAALGKIPYGQTNSYSDIAEMIQRPAAVRAVGTAIGANPVLIVVPCHRVIGKNGAITGYRGGIEMKEYLLALEGQNRS